MEMQYKYIIGALIFGLISVSAALVTQTKAIFLVAEQKRAMR